LGSLNEQVYDRLWTNILPLVYFIKTSIEQLRFTCQEWTLLKQYMNKLGTLSALSHNIMYKYPTVVNFIKMYSEQDDKAW